MKRKLWTAALCGFGMLVLILDTKTAMFAARDAMDICLMTVVPSLLPFIIISILLTNIFTGLSSPLLRPLGKLCRMPYGTESILILGLLGGYPTGAQATAQAYHSGQIEKEDAQRLLGFCSNAGPSFLFGITGALFPQIRYAWVLWIIHILSAVLTGWLLPGKKDQHSQPIPAANPISVSLAVERAIRTMVRVCGWVFLFRIILAFFQRWFLWMIPASAQIIFCGLLELTNGCLMLNTITLPGLRFLICSGFLAFGGLCVMMQTISVTGSLGSGKYFPGKVIQTFISVYFAYLAQMFLFPPSQAVPSIPVVMIMPVVGAALWKFAQILKNYSRFSQKIGV